MRPFVHATLSALLLVGFGSGLAAQDSASRPLPAASSESQRGQHSAPLQQGEPTAAQLKTVQRRRAAAHGRLPSQPLGLVARERLARINGTLPTPAPAASEERAPGHVRSNASRSWSQPGVAPRTAPRTSNHTRHKTSPRTGHRAGPKPGPKTGSKRGPKQGAAKSRPAQRSRKR